MRNYSWGYAFFIACVIIFCVFLMVGYGVVYYNCMFFPVSDLPGYCLSFL